MNTLTTAADVLTGSVAGAGAGLIAKSRETVSLPWVDVKTVTLYPGPAVIKVYGGPMSRFRLFCDRENYAKVEALLRQYAKNASFRIA